MRYVIVDCGPVGWELARQWRAEGHQVVGTTPHPDQLPRLQEVCDEALELAHGDGDRVRDVVREADGAVLATRPHRNDAGSARERVLSYRRSMISVVRAAASVQRRLVLFSSTVVYGDGGPDAVPVTEKTPVTTSLDPAAQSFAAVERMALESPEAAVLRLPEAVVGHPSDPFDASHQSASGQLVDYRDVAAAVAFVVARHLTGVFNVVPDQPVPPGTRPISSAKLGDAGFRFHHPLDPADLGTMRTR